MNSKKEVQHVYLVGAKSLGAYGGYETFVYKLTEYHQNKENIKYHVACKANGDGCMDESKFDGVTKINDHEFEFHNAHCFKIDVPQIGPAQAIYYDVAALKACCEHIKKNHIPHPIVYIMACRIGPFASHFYREIHKLGGTVYLNPDGHEWMRAKWSAPIRKYWKISEQMMVKYCDLAICDSVNIEKYIHECYDGKGIQGSSPKTTFIHGDSYHIAVEGHIGTWYAIDETEVGDEKFFLLEHEEHGDMAACVAVNEQGKLVAEELWNGFDEDFQEAVRKYFSEKWNMPKKEDVVSEIIEKAAPVPDNSAQDYSDVPVYYEPFGYAKENDEVDGVMSNVHFDELELMLMAMFEQPTLKDTIQVLTEVQPLVAEDAEMAALVQQTIPKMQQLNEQQFKGLELEWYRPEDDAGK